MTRELCILIDFGSTYTKVRAVDIKMAKLIATAQSASTVETDLTTGLNDALNKLRPDLSSEEIRGAEKLACSSAAGGLRMVTIGLVPDLTAEAAKRAALGAGAKVVGTFAFKLADHEIKDIINLKPDIILLAGGTDGGDEKVILHNARMICKSDISVSVVIAGNKVVSGTCREILSKEGKIAHLTKNVMPEINKLNVEPVREVIREIFINRIVEAKGLNKAEEFVGKIIAPTPVTVLKAATLLAKGIRNKSGWGELMVVDVGGATTDVHTIASGKPKLTNVVLKGLPEPEIKRTVEGDLGIRYNSQYILDAVGEEYFAEKMGLPVDEIKDMVQKLSNDIGFTPTQKVEYDLDALLAEAAIEIATKRHAGSIKAIYMPTGLIYVQYGKDLTEIKTLIGTGGVFTYNEKSRDILRKSLFDKREPSSLRPKNPNLFIDRDYIMSAMGLLAEVHPKTAFGILENSLICDTNQS